MVRSPHIPHSRRKDPEVATDIITQAIQTAVNLREQKEQTYDAIAANRRWLRDSDATGLLTAEQSAWLADFYPPKAPKNGDGTAE